MKNIVCPSCQKKTFHRRKRRCVSNECDLHNASSVLDNEKMSFSWVRLWWNIYYFRPRDLIRIVKNILWMRPDLVRTGLAKTHWTDVDHKMFYSVMNLFESFVIEEDGGMLIDIEEYKKEYEEEWGNPPYEEEILLLIDQNKTTKKIIDLYFDWKITYPNMRKHLNKLLNDVDVDSVDYFAFQAEVDKYENSLMKRVVDLRYFMWT